MFRHLLAKRRSGPAPIIEEGLRIYAVGDIHGRSDLLIALLERIEADASRRVDGLCVKLVFLGDYIDRGLKSRDVLAILRRLSRRSPQDTTFLKGNHEAAALAFLDDPLRGADWLRMGGAQTFESYGVSPPGEYADASVVVAQRDALRAAMGPDEDFLRSALSRFAQSGRTLFVHAGVDPRRTLDQQTDGSLLWGKAPGFRDDRGLPGMTVIHGHTPTKAPDERPWRIGIDTGAFYSNRLTAIRLDSSGFEFLSSQT